MPQKSQTASQYLRSALLLFAVVGNLVFSVVFLLSMGAHVVSSNKQPTQTAVKKTAPINEQRVVTLGRIN
jgi:hypothetical protein